MEYLVQNHQLTAVEAVTWLNGTKWMCRPQMSRKTLDLVCDTLIKVGVLKEGEAPGDVADVCAKCITSITDDEHTNGRMGAASNGVERFLPANSIFNRVLK